MHRTYRQLLLALVAIISLAITCNKCRQQQQLAVPQGWTPELESQMRDIFYTQSARLTTNDEERNAFADCCMAKIKELYPNGVAAMGGQLTDSMKMAVLKMGADCTISFKSRTNIWQPEVIEQFKLGLYSYPETKMLPQAMKKEYVDCLTFAVMAKFPKGVSDTGKDSLKTFITAQRTKCLRLLANKYGKSKVHKTIPDTATAR